MPRAELASSWCDVTTRAALTGRPLLRIGTMKTSIGLNMTLEPLRWSEPPSDVSARGRASGAARASRSRPRRRRRSAAAALPSWNDGPAKQAILDFVRATTTTSRARFRAAGRAHRRIRPGRHALGRASGLHAVRLLPRPCWRAREREAGAEGPRTVQDRSFRRPRGDREALDAGLLRDRARHPERDGRGGVPGRYRESGWPRPSIRAGTAPTPNWCISP